MATNYPVNPRVRAYGKARIDLARRANNGEDWKRIWKAPLHPYPFRLGGAWKQCVEYKVDDFPAEVGFYIDVLGLQVNSLDRGYAQFTSPQNDFYFAILETPPGGNATPPDALRIQFMIEDIFETAQGLESRGIAFDMPPQACQPGSKLFIGSFRTPHGISIELWSILQEADLSHYAESEHDLYDLMSHDDDPEPRVGEAVQATNPEDLQDEAEEFFPRNVQTAPQPAAPHHPAARPHAAISSTARGNIPTIPSLTARRKMKPVRPDDLFSEDHTPDAIPEEDADEDVEYVDEIDGA